MPEVLLSAERLPETLRPLHDGLCLAEVLRDEHGITLSGKWGSKWIANWDVWEQAVSQAVTYIKTEKPERWTKECGHGRFAYEAALLIVQTERYEREHRQERVEEADRAYQASRRAEAARRHAAGEEQRRIAVIQSRVDTSTVKLWPHQERAVPIVYQKAREGARRILLVGPTGMGKMVLAAYFMAKTSERGRNSLFLADIRELIGQCQEKLHAYGVDAGIVMAQSDARNDDLAQIASKDTLWSRAFRTDKMLTPKANLLLVDEAHKSRAETWTKVIEHYRDAVVLGFTATPCRQDGKGLGALWDEMVIVATYRELREAGVIVPCKIYAPHVPDMKGVPTVAGDYSMPEVRKRMDKVTLVGDIVKDWRKRADGRQTVCFASGVEHSIHILNQFRKHGIACEHLDSKNVDWRQREDVLGRLHDGLVQVVTNYGILTTGWDEPSVSCMICARPTRSLQLWRQMAGRVLRSDPGSNKKDAIILDHSGAVFRHGFPDDDIDWELTQDSNVHEKVKEKLKKEAREGKDPYACPTCATVYRGPQCPGCGYKPTVQERAVPMKVGELTEVERIKAQEVRRRTHTLEQKQQAWDDVIGWAIGNNRKTGAAAHRYRELYGAYPANELKRVPRGKRQWNMPAREFYEEMANEFLRRKQE